MASRGLYAILTGVADSMNKGIDERQRRNRQDQLMQRQRQQTLDDRATARSQRLADIESDHKYREGVAARLAKESKEAADLKYKRAKILDGIKAGKKRQPDEITPEEVLKKRKMFEESRYGHINRVSVAKFASYAFPVADGKTQDPAALEDMITEKNQAMIEASLGEWEELRGEPNEDGSDKSAAQQMELFGAVLDRNFVRDMTPVMKRALIGTGVPDFNVGEAEITDAVMRMMDRGQDSPFEKLSDKEWYAVQDFSGEETEEGTMTSMASLIARLLAQGATPEEVISDVTELARALNLDIATTPSLTNRVVGATKQTFKHVPQGTYGLK